MENKYYTPEISEFYVGFEFEIASYGGKMLPGSPTIKEWIQDKLTSDLYDINYILDIYNEGKQCTDIRVKYLDQSDIEELGFKLIFNDIGIEYWKLGNFELRTDVDLGVYIDSDNLYSIFYNPYGKQYNCVFSGVIKNKSELKKILQMLNIK